MKKLGIILQASFLVVLLLVSSCKKAPETNQSSARKVERTSESIAVGVFKGNGTIPFLVTETVQALSVDNGLVVVTLDAVDILKSKLQNIDVLVFPGGSSQDMMLDLNAEGARIVSEFVEVRGKGVVGICGGSTLLSSTSGLHTLNIAKVSVAEPEMKGPGHALVAFELTSEGEGIFPELSDENPLVLRYYNGPLFENQTSTLLGTITTDVYQTPEQKGQTPGKLLFANGKFGKGNYFLSVGHPESTRGMRWMLPRMVRWVADKQIVSYQGNIVRPGAIGKELLFTKQMQLREQELFAQLSHDNKGKRLTAIEELETLNSWNAHEWVVGMLRDRAPEVRVRAAKYLTDHECTFALNDLEVAIANEKDASTASELNQYFLLLQGIVEG
ncbi:MAG: DJ-1/PfpI family protein [Bacteroidales bacterium]